MVGDTIYCPQGLVAYRGGTVSCPIRSLVHVPLDGTHRTRTWKRGGGGDGMYVHGFMLEGGCVTSRDVIGVGSRRGRHGVCTTLNFFFS